jgi:hypothetical protein
MEINENVNDTANYEIDEAEENTFRTIDTLKVKDVRLCMLYLNKAKNYFNDKEAYNSYVDFANSYITLKEEKKKKTEENKNRKKSIESVSDFEQDIQNQSFLKKKKGRPKTSKSEYVEIKKVEVPKPKVVVSAKPIVQQNKENKLKSDNELYEENLNTRSQLPLPAQICFSDPTFIYEINCYLCGSFDDQPLILTCCLCYENFHSYCISNSELITANILLVKDYDWKCQNCKFCEECKTNENDSNLLYCDSCDRGFHTNCLSTPLNIVPETGWKCLSCFKCQSCGTNKYYQDSFNPNPDKDYSKFTRNFNYCYECGLRTYYLSMCAKCNISVIYF